MARLRTGFAFATGVLIAAISANADPLEYLGKPVGNVPISRAVKAGEFVFVGATPAFDANGKVAVADFSAQMKQVMENIRAILKAADTDWDHVVKTTVFLTRNNDFAEMNRIYGSYFPNGKFPARTTVIVAGLPSPDFLLEIECEAVLK
jgi:reactive intermediate/imine deaminase